MEGGKVSDIILVVDVVAPLMSTMCVEFPEAIPATASTIVVVSALYVDIDGSPISSTNNVGTWGLKITFRKFCQTLKKLKKTPKTDLKCLKIVFKFSL